jgi:hypothetical protein
MCDKCSEYEDKIARYKLMAARITDQQTLAGIAGLIEQVTAAKAALHPPSNQPTQLPPVQLRSWPGRSH